MSNKTNKIGKWNVVVSMMLAVAFLVAANVKADYITSHVDPQSYYAVGQAHDWVLQGFSGNKDDWNFTAKNTATGETVSGLLKSWGQNGNSGFDNPVENSDGTVNLSHNTSIYTSLSFTHGDIDKLGSGFINSFYFEIDPHDNSNTLNLDVTAVAWINGELVKEKLHQVGGGFYGYTLEEGYFVEFIIGVDYGKNNGGYDSLLIGLGDTGNTFTGEDFGPPNDRPGTTAVVPEPATIALLGLGLAGLGVARARRKK